MSLTLDPRYTGGAGAVSHLISWNHIYCYDRVTGLVLVLVTWLGLESGWTCSQERAWACTSCPLLGPLITPGPWTSVLAMPDIYSVFISWDKILSPYSKESIYPHSIINHLYFLLINLVR